MAANIAPHIRYATEADIPLIKSLIQELAEYEEASSSVAATDEKLLATLSFPVDQSATTVGQDAIKFGPGFARTFLIFAQDDSIPESSDPKVKPLHSLPQPKCAGMALYFFNYSTWTAAPGVYLEDLFIRPQYRRRGYASLLFTELAREVKRIGGARLDWSVLKWNEPSIRFYEKAIGAKMMSEWVGMRVDGAGLDKLAEGNEGHNA